MDAKVILGPSYSLSWQQKLQGTTAFFKLWVILDPSSPLLCHEQSALRLAWGWKGPWPTTLVTKWDKIIASIPSFNLFPRMHTIVFFFHNPCQNAEENEVTVAGVIQRRDLLFAAAAFHQLKHWQRSLTNVCQILQTKPRNSKAAVLKE